jgi:DNA-binding response OmpR family regulator
MPERILIVEDDQTMLGVLKYNILKAGYDVGTAEDGLEAITAARNEKPDLIILDLMLPKMDGLEVTRILRKDLTTPILMLTARGEDIDKVVGLELGADDYMTKPFSMRELLARVKALLRRNQIATLEAAVATRAQAQAIEIGDIKIDTSRHTAQVKGVNLDLTPKEFDLLTFLAANRGRVFGRDALLEKVWGYDFGGDTRTVDVHVRWLRQKIEENPDHPARLITVRGVGYKLEGATDSVQDIKAPLTKT